ncbi:MAG: aminoglycoside phosphotransferase family protein [Candidatus Thorarchaeota archaeon]|nr:aminoglycoside phosphotransferase family protein [Candidatus Thorarchaeota archaeon]
MTRHQGLIHGLTVSQLELLLNEAICWDEPVRLAPQPLGGWSSINLLGVTDSERVTVKLPARVPPYPENPFERLHSVYKKVGASGVCPRPLASGRLADRAKTPFLILQFVEGRTVSDIEDLLPATVTELRRALARLNSTDAIEGEVYDRPSDMLRYHCARVRLAIAHHSLPEADLFLRTTEGLNEYLDNTCEWTQAVVHGDLQEPNILLTDRGVVLLDLESCCVADPFYDLSYLSVQRAGGGMKAVSKHLVHSLEESRVESLAPLSLSSVISWSLERLAAEECGLIESSVSSPRSRDAIRRYVRSKLTHLKALSRLWHR